MTTATVSSKGQITLPADVLRVLQVDVGDRVEFFEVGPGRFEFVAIARPVTDLKGMFRKTSKVVSIAEMNRAIAAQGANA
jgi:antitoxin PrlF